MIKLHTRVIMDSGIEYIFEMSEKEFTGHVMSSDGTLLNNFVRLSTNKQDVSINPVHISSIEELEINTAQRIGIL